MFRMCASNSHSYTHLIQALGIVRELTVWVFITSKYPGTHDIGLPTGSTAMPPMLAMSRDCLVGNCLCMRRRVWTHRTSKTLLRRSCTVLCIARLRVGARRSMPPTCLSSGAMRASSMRQVRPRTTALARAWHFKWAGTRMGMALATRCLLAPSGAYYTERRM